MCPKDRLFKGYIELELQVNKMIKFIKFYKNNKIKVYFKLSVRVVRETNLEREAPNASAPFSAILFELYLKKKIIKIIRK